jgi:hypothetical protein
MTRSLKRDTLRRHITSKTMRERERERERESQRSRTHTMHRRRERGGLSALSLSRYVSLTHTQRGRARARTAETAAERGGREKECGIHPPKRGHWPRTVLRQPARAPRTTRARDNSQLGQTTRHLQQQGSVAEHTTVDVQAYGMLAVQACAKNLTITMRS